MTSDLVTLGATQADPDVPSLFNGVCNIQEGHANIIPHTIKPVLNDTLFHIPSNMSSMTLYSTYHQTCPQWHFIPHTIKPVLNDTLFHIPSNMSSMTLYSTYHQTCPQWHFIPHTIKPVLNDTLFHIPSNQSSMTLYSTYHQTCHQCLFIPNTCTVKPVLNSLRWGDTLWYGDTFSKRCPIFPMLKNLWWRDICL